MKKLCILFILFLISYSNLIGQLNNDSPLIPVNTNFSYWDHHWIMWTPQHQKYEAIEVMTQDNTKNPESKLIRIFFTERSGNKKQVHYFNDIETAKNWKGEAYFRTVEYEANGEPEHPLNLHIKFLDKDSLWVEWNVNFEKKQLLSTQYSGLKDQGGHAAETVFLIFYSGRNATTTNASLLINGKDFSSQESVLPEDNKRYYVAAYSTEVYTAVISYAQSNYSVIPEGLKNSWGRTFKKTVDLKSGFLYRSNSFGFNNNSIIEIETNVLGEIMTYSHLYSGHSFNIKFEPALPSIKLVSAGISIRYIVSLDNFIGIVEGMLQVKKEKDIIQLYWEHQSPAWAKKYQFQTDIQTYPAGYNISSTLLHKNP